MTLLGSNQIFWPSIFSVTPWHTKYWSWLEIYTCAKISAKANWAKFWFLWNGRMRSQLFPISGWISWAHFLLTVPQTWQTSVLDFSTIVSSWLSLSCCVNICLCIYKTLNRKKLIEDMVNNKTTGALRSFRPMCSQEHYVYTLALI